MSSFPSDVHALFAKWNEHDVLASIEAAHQEHLDRRIAVVEYGSPATLAPKRRAAKNCQLLQQALLHRSERLVWSLGSLLLEGNVYGLALVARGQLEATAVLGYFCRRLELLAAGGVRFEDFEWNIADAVMGAKHELFSKARAPINILTCIEKADKYLDQHFFKSDRRMLKDNYNWLSEFAHPNFLSSFSAYMLDKEKGEFLLRHGAGLREEDFQLPKYLEVGAQLFVVFFDAFTDRLAASGLNSA